MDGVERVMVLGILAVIVAILSFAWSATDESATPVGALERDSGRVVGTEPGSGSPISLSSNSRTGDSVVLDENARNRITERMRANSDAREAQLKQRWNMMNDTQVDGRPAGDTGAGLPTRSGALIPMGEPPRAGARPEQSQSPDLPPSARDQLARGMSPPNQLPADGVKPSVRIPLKPEAAQNEGRDLGSDETGFRLYTVSEGDTLWGIAYRTAGVGDTKRIVQLILDLNPGLAAESLSIGRTIKLPVAVPAQLQVKPPTERALETGGRVYVVAEGDSLGLIAAIELGDGSRWKDIYQLNKTTIPDPERIRPGQRLILPEE